MAAEELDSHDMREETQQALQTAYECLPPEHPWGYFHYLDGPPAAGGGVGCFAWFKSRDALLAFITRYQAWIGAPEGSEIPAKRAKQVQRVIARVQAGQISMELARLQINEILRTFAQIDGWGHTDKLLTGDSDFACELREWCRDFSRNWRADATPIAPAEAQGFFYALQVFGM